MNTSGRGLHPLVIVMRGGDCLLCADENLQIAALIWVICFYGKPVLSQEFISSVAAIGKVYPTVRRCGRSLSVRLATGTHDSPGGSAESPRRSANFPRARGYPSDRQCDKLAAHYSSITTFEDT